MKKILIILFISISTLYAQSIEKNTHINSKTIANGGTYTLIQGTPGRISLIENLIIEFDYKDSLYSTTGSDSIRIKTENPGGIADVLYISDSLLTQYSNDYVIYSKDINTVSSYGNSIYLYLPSSQFTGGNSEFYINIEYKLVK